MSDAQPDRDRRIDDVVAKFEIHEVMMRYARGVNRLDADLVRACFHPDAWEDHGMYRGDAATFAAGFTPGGFRTFKSMFHHIGNELTELYGDRATHEAYFVGYHRYTEDGVDKDMYFGGRYLAVFERRDGGPWLIANRTVVHDWSRIDTVHEPWAPADLFVQGRFDPEDLVFRLLEPGRAPRPPVPA